MQNLPWRVRRRAYLEGFALSSWLVSIGLAIGIGVAYFLAARLSLELLTKPDGVAVFWPAAGIASGVMIALGAQARLPVAAGVIAATIAANLLGDRSPSAAVVFALCNATEAILIAWLIQRHLGSNFSLDSVRRVVGFIVAAGVGAAVSGIGGTAGFALFHRSDTPLITTWTHWFASDALGTIAVAPLILGLARLRHDLPERWGSIEGTLTLAALAAVSAIAFSSPDHWYTILPLGLLLPVLLAAHCHPVFAAASALILGYTVVWTTIFGIGGLDEPTLHFSDRVYAGRATLLAISICTLVLAALFAERRRNEAALKDGSDRLQLALAGAGLGVWSIDAKSGRFESDARDSHIHGYQPDAPPRTLEEARAFIHPNDLPYLDAAFAASKLAGGSCNVEYRLASAFGSADADQERWVAVEGKVVRDAAGAPARWLGVTRDITERKQAERTIAERSTQLALAGKVGLVGGFTFDLGTGTMRISPGYSAIHGLPEETEETSRAEWRARVHADDLPRLDVHLQQAIAGRKREHYCEYRIVRPDGTVRWIESRSVITYDDDGNAHRVIGSNIDVTERKDTEARLKESADLLAAALAAGQVIAFEWDAVTHRSRRSDNAALILGREEGNLAGAEHSDFLRRIHADDRESFKARIRELCPETPSYSLIFRFCRSDGRYVWFEETARGEFDAGGQLLRIKGLTRDITERKQVEERLQRSERRLRELLEALPVAIYVTDAAGRITYYNQGAADLWGAKPKLSVDKWSDLARFYYDDGTPMPVEECPSEIALKQGRIVRNLEAILARPDGTRIPIVAYPTPLYDGTSAVAGIVNMMVDISDRKKAELVLAERAMQLSLAGKAALVGSFSYDIGSDQIQVSAGYAALHGFPDETTEITRGQWLLGVHPEDRARLEDLRSRIFSKRSDEYGADYRIVRPDGEVRWIEARCFVTYRSDGCPQRVVGVNIDTTERKRSEDHQRALNAELDHRVKNVLATVSAIITQTPKADNSLADFVTGFGNRIKSLAETHELLSHNRWHGVSLEEIVRCELKPYATGNAAIGGPRVILRAEAAQAVAMVLHELATNAGKYGAFSNQGGRLSLRWRWLRNGKQGRLAIEWQELGGPTVLVPEQSGYGTSVIRELIPFELGGTADLDFSPDGLRCRLEIPADWIRRAGRATNASCRLDAARPDARA